MSGEGSEPNAVGSEQAGVQGEPDPDRKGKRPTAAEKKERALEEHRRKMALVEQTLPPVETAFSRRQSPLFGKVGSASEPAKKEETFARPAASETGKEVSADRPGDAEVIYRRGQEHIDSGSEVLMTEEKGGVVSEVAPAQEHEQFGGPAEVSEGRSVFLRGSNDPNTDAIYENIAGRLREFKKRRKPFGGVRLHMRVSADVFSAVSQLAFAKRLDKVEIVTFLLRQYLPEPPYDVVPKWMLREGEETTVKEYALPYLQDSDLDEAFRALQFRWQLYRVDLLEAIVLHYLPAAKGLVRPKRRVRARVVSKLGGR